MYDAVVIGAGPGGSAAAYHASRHGLRVLLLDRTPFPRPKTCGDALSPRALAAIGRMDITELPGRPVRGMRMRDLAGGQESREDFRRHGGAGAGLVVVRETLDRLLLERAAAAGATFEVGHAVEILWWRERVRGVVIRGAHGTYTLHADAVIGATGSSSSGRLAGSRPQPAPVAWGIAGRTYLDLDDDFGDDLEVYFPVDDGGGPLYGYGWVFPVGPRRVNVGVGLVGPPERAVSIRALIERFIDARRSADPRLRGAVADGVVSTAPVAVGPRIEPRPGLLPVGDFAGLANPLTGEGIAAAVESGEMAAEELAASGGNAASTYAERLRRHLPRYFALRSTLPAVYRGPSLFLARGWDVVRAGGDGPSAALRRFIWDQPAAPQWWRGLTHDRKMQAEIDAVRADIVAAFRRLRPLLAELVACVIDDPDTRFGWYAALAASIRPESGEPRMPEGEAPAPDPDPRAVVVVLEIVNLVHRLHADLLEDRPGRDRVWGKNTLGLVVADCLTACALRRLYGLPRAWAARLGTMAARTFRQAAIRHSCGREEPAALAETSLFLAAARAALGLAPADPVASELRAAGLYLAQLKGSGLALPRPVRLAGARLDALLDTLARAYPATAPGDGRAREAG